MRRTAIHLLGVLVLAVSIAALFVSNVLAGSTIAIAGEPAFCEGIPLTPVSGTYIVGPSCVVNLQIVWPADMVSAHLDGSVDGGATWQELGDPPGVFPPTSPGLLSGLGINCDAIGSGTWLFRAHGFDSTNASLYSDPFPYAVSFCPSAEALLVDLFSLVDSEHLGPGTSLHDKLVAVLADLEAGDSRGACETLQAFISQVKAQTGKSISTEEASLLTSNALRIKNTIGC
jgi:hypothetical protein